MTQPYTNKHGWAPELVTALLKNRYHDDNEDPFDFSCSTLVAPTQLTVLRMKHPEKQVVEDVSDMFWKFLGSISHTVLEEAFHDQDNGDGSFVEKRLYLEVMGKKISGKLDLYSAARQEIRDYKSTKAYKIIKGDFEEWEKSQNIYAHLLEANGHPVKKLTIIPLIFDFKPSEAYKKGYPQSASGTIDLKLWTSQQQKAYIEARVKALIAAENLSDDDLANQFPCSDKEMWRDLKDYAIVKPGAAKATLAGFESEAEAAKAFHEKGCSYGTHEIVKRMEGRRRCKGYCPMRQVCVQNKRLSVLEGTPLTEDLEPCIF